MDAEKWMLGLLEIVITQNWNKILMPQKIKNKKIKKITKIPKSFQGILWSYKFSSIDSIKDQERIIINAINYGDWEHWRWVFNYYGIATVKKIIENIPTSELRPRALKLISLLLKIRKIKYATRGAKIRAEKNI